MLPRRFSALVSLVPIKDHRRYLVELVGLTVQFAGTVPGSKLGSTLHTNLSRTACVAKDQVRRYVALQLQHAYYL